MKNDLQSCVQFAQTLFGNDGCKALAGDIHLRTFIRQISEQMVVRWNTVRLCLFFQSAHFIYLFFCNGFKNLLIQFLYCF